MKEKSIAVVGMGYVGLSTAVLLSQRHRVLALDISRQKLTAIQQRRAPFKDREIEQYLKEKDLKLEVTFDDARAYREAEFIVVAVPTNFDVHTQRFDTGMVETVVRRAVAVNPEAGIIIKSTVPVGFTETLRRQLGYRRVFFNPEFLRESRALHDQLYPSRLIIGLDRADVAEAELAADYMALLREGSLKKDVELLYLGLGEAEAVKLFSNAYLAMRIAFFNELDSYAQVKKLNTAEIIEGVCLDERIGSSYRNPSFGYGGYCLPKDTLQLSADFKDIPGRLIGAVIESNQLRKEYIAQSVWRQLQAGAGKAKPTDIAQTDTEPVQSRPTVGIYRLSMKQGSDNFRQSAVLDIIHLLGCQPVRILVYEPQLSEDSIPEGTEYEPELSRFKQLSQIIIANRNDGQLDDVRDKVFTRDIFHED